MDLVNDDKFLEQCSKEYYNAINQHELLDETPQGKLISNVAFKLIKGVENYLSQIGRSDYTQNYYDWEFHLINYNVVNAFCMPGGKIVMYSGILSVADSEETTAFILAHEMAHALLDHGRTRVSAQKLKNTLTTVSRLGGIGLSLVGLGELGSATNLVTNMADIGSEFLVMKPFGRSHEIEADKLGIMIIHWAGYDILGIPEFWQKMSEKNSNNYDFFSTHPSDSKRINAMLEVINDIHKDEDFDRQQLIESSKISNSLIPQEDSSQKIESSKISNSLIPQEDSSQNRCTCGNIINSEDIYCNNCGKKLISKLHCPNCNAIIDDENKFCINCGFKLISDNDVCKNCGNKLDPDDNFCMKCGFKVE